MSPEAAAIPQPPSSTILTSDQPPRTLWMGDLDPSFDEATIQQIWAQLGQRVNVKLIRAKKNLLIPCSTSSTFNSSEPQFAAGASAAGAGAPATPAAGSKININGVSFIDPSTTQLHHAGYCFVEFESLADAQWALALNATPLPNVASASTRQFTNPSGLRNFRLNWASGATLQSAIPSTPEFSLFVGDLSPTATEAHLLSLFQKNFKSVKTVRVLTDPITGASRCFGFVRFGDEQERRRALAEMNGVWCQGRNLRVAYATPRNNVVWQLTQQQQQRPNAPTHIPDVLAGAPQFAPHAAQQAPLLMKTANSLVDNNLISIPSSNLVNEHSTGSGPSQLTPVVARSNFANPHNTTVFIGGLTSNTTERHLHSLFSPFGTIINVKIPPGKGCGFVKYANRIDAEAAIQGMQGFIVGGNPIRLSWGRTSADTTRNVSFLDNSPAPTGNTDAPQTFWNSYPSNTAPVFVPQHLQREDPPAQPNSVPPVHPSLL
ncbi:LAFE_0C07404g1_1 [Lachancea fermentati]|uniref:LAFE_0C07404g1_1 n=1 Tax=Lachancea fermentati TaxID=4955 RepID=A0A1G4M9P0_LACFM|nr:LAFE_0C07404g1_1 [Lachancea fermentati]